MARCRPYGVLRIVLSTLLISAAALKLNSILAHSERLQSSFYVPMWLVYQSVIIELILGIWLLTGLFMRQAWIATGFCFICFSAISAVGIFLGQEVCGCLGVFSVSPWLMLLLDLSVLAGMWFIRPPFNGGAISETRPLRPRHLWVQYAVLSAVFVSGSVVMAFGAIPGLKREAPSDDIGYSVETDEFAHEHRFNGIDQDLNLFLSQAGFDSNRYAAPEVSSTLTELIADLSQHHGLDGEIVQSCDAGEALGELTDEMGCNPILLERKDGRYLLVMGLCSDQAEHFYEVVSRNRPPVLINTKFLDLSGFARAWTIPLRKQKGITYEFGGSVLHVDRTFHNCGLVAPHGRVSTTFHIRNAGNSPITVVDRPDTSCACTIANYETNGSIAPGESFPLHVSVKAKTGGFRENASVAFVNAQGDETLKVHFELLGAQMKSMQFSPSMLDFGRVRNGVEAVRRLRISETSSDRFRIVDIGVAGLPLEHRLTVRNKGDSTDRHDYEVEFTLNDKSSEFGAHQGLLKIVTDSRLLKTYTIPVKYHVESNIRLHPPAISFGPVQRDSSAEQSAVLVEADGEPLQAQLVSMPDDFVAELLPTEHGSYKLVVRPKTEKTGPISGTIIVKTSTASGPEREVGVKCAAYVQ